MKVFDLLNEIVSEIEESRKSLFSTKKTIDVDFVMEILQEIQNALPKDIEHARKIIDHEQKIIRDAEKKAEEVMTNADEKIAEMIEEHRVTQLAYEKSNRIIDVAQQQALELRKNANDYAVDVLEDLTSYLHEYVDIIKENKSNFINKRNKDQASFLSDPASR